MSVEFRHMESPSSNRPDAYLQIYEESSNGAGPIIGPGGSLTTSVHYLHPDITGLNVMSTSPDIGFSEREFVIVEVPSYRVGVFTLDLDEDGQYFFADVVGAMYGVGDNLPEAFQDWFESAEELRGELLQDQSKLSIQRHLSDRLSFLEASLGPAEIGNT